MAALKPSVASFGGFLHKGPYVCGDYWSDLRVEGSVLVCSGYPM